MKLAALAALEQRTALRYTMPGMTATETSSYIAHHLKLAGRPDQLFTDDALNLIHTTARGYPRAVNNLALQSLVAAFVTGKNLVDDTVPRAAPGCADPPDHRPRRSRHPRHPVPLAADHTGHRSPHRHRAAGRPGPAAPRPGEDLVTIDTHTDHPDPQFLAR